MGTATTELSYLNTTEVITSKCGRGQEVALNHQRQGEHDYCNGLQNQSSNQDSMTRKDLWHWLGDRRIPKSEIDGKSTKFLLDLYKQKSSRSSEQFFF